MEVRNAAKKYAMKTRGIKYTYAVIDLVNDLYEQHKDNKRYCYKYIARDIKERLNLEVPPTSVGRLLREYGRYDLYRDKVFKDKTPFSHKWDFSPYNVQQPQF